jgi:hypothetical protein
LAEDLAPLQRPTTVLTVREDSDDAERPFRMNGNSKHSEHTYRVAPHMLEHVYNQRFEVFDHVPLAKVGPKKLMRRHHLDTTGVGEHILADFSLAEYSVSAMIRGFLLSEMVEDCSII